MSNKIYAKQNGTWEDLERIIKTARDWQASEIVIVGVRGLDGLVEELSERWDQYMIPISVRPTDGESVRDEFAFPPFTGVGVENEVAEKMLAKQDETQVIVENGVLRSFRPVTKSEI